MTGDPSSLDTMSSTKVFPCNACGLVFKDSQAQRTHMREPWHVYNLKRRMASLEPISADTYTEKVATSLVSNKQNSLDAATTPVTIKPSPGAGNMEQSDESQDLVDDNANINHCLFCNKLSDNLDTNIDHMSSEHGLYVPEIEHLSSLETMIGYLHTVITEYNECLYCGMVKQSADRIRRHMLDKGHCMINLDREPELLEFWDFSDSDGDAADGDQTSKLPSRKTDMASLRDVLQGEYILPSGKVVASKDRAREARSFARQTASATRDAPNRIATEDRVHNTDIISSTGPDESLPKPRGRTRDGTIAVRDAAGLVGVSSQQMRSLVTVHRKMQRQQAVVRASAVWADEKGGTHQKHFKTKMNLRDG